MAHPHNKRILSNRRFVATVHSDDHEVIRAAPELLKHLTNIVDAWGEGDGGKHVGQFVDAAQLLVEQLRKSG